MKIATSTEDFKRYYKNDCDMVRELYAAGFRYIDLSMYSFKPDCVYMSDEWKNEVQKLKDCAKSLGMQFVQAHSQGGNPLNEDEVGFIVDATLRSVDICAELGIKNTVVHPGFAPGISKEEWFERNKKFFDKLLPYAAGKGVNILAENSTKANMGEMYFITTGKDMYDFIEYVGNSSLHACWDTGHANCEGPQYDEIMAIGEELYAIHYNDNRGKQDEHLMPYLGTMNHDEVLHALIDVGFKGYFTLECGSSLRNARCWLGKRRPYEPDTRLAEPQLFMQRQMEKLMYDTSAYILQTYGLYEG